MAILQLKEVSYAYNQDNKVIKNISLDILSEDFWALVGANGSGKTTLAKILTGIFQPLDGQYLIDGKNSRKITLGELGTQIGFVQQNSIKQFFTSSVNQEIAFGLKNRKVERTKIERTVKEILEYFSLEKHKESHPLTLSQGERKRLAVACMVVLKPKFIILDEPTAGLDRRNKGLMLDFLKKINQQDRIGIVVITHDLDWVSSYASKLAVLANGGIAYQGEIRKAFLQRQIWHDLQFPLPQIIEVSYKLHEKFNLPFCLDEQSLVRELKRVLGK